MNLGWLIPPVIALSMPILLVASQRPVEKLDAASSGLRFPTRSETTEAQPLTFFQARDGAKLGMRHYQTQNEDAPLVVMVHGSGWHGLQFDSLGTRLAAAGLADVIAIDLRGHGPSPAKRGDIEYIGQLEDDVADVIQLHRKPAQKLILLGHSSGGGLVLRFAGGAHGAMLDAAVLMAPFLGHSAPTTRTQSGGWARVLVRRIIGLSILNKFGFKALNGLTIIQFRFPETVLEGPLGATATSAYSYRLNTSYAPHADVGKDIAALPQFLLIAGSEDEAFFTDQYQPTLSEHSARGQYQVIDGAGHLDVVDDERSFQALSAWLTSIAG